MKRRLIGSHLRCCRQNFRTDRANQVNDPNSDSENVVAHHECHRMDSVHRCHHLPPGAYTALLLCSDDIGCCEMVTLRCCRADTAIVTRIASIQLLFP